MKGKENIDVKVVKKEDFKKNFWAPFRVPTGTDQEILKDPWTSPWIREKGKKKFWADLRFKGNVERMPLDIKDKKNNYVISAKLPDLSKEDITIEAAEKNLILIGNQRKKETKLGRAIKFKEKIEPEKAKASYKDNELEIKIPKRGKIIEKAGKEIKMEK